MEPFWGANLRLWKFQPIWTFRLKKLLHGYILGLFLGFIFRSYSSSHFLHFQNSETEKKDLWDVLFKKLECKKIGDAPRMKGVSFPGHWRINRNLAGLFEINTVTIEMSLAECVSLHKGLEVPIPIISQIQSRDQTFCWPSPNPAPNKHHEYSLSFLKHAVFCWGDPFKLL